MDDKMETFDLGGGFTFAGTGLDELGASEYTLVTIAVDETGSVMGFADELREMLVTTIASCQASDRSENLLVRVVTFGSQHDQGVNELHGFKPLADIDVADYPAIQPGGMTPLYDAVYSSVGALNAYGQQLVDDGYGVNAITFIITDGADNRSTTTPKMVQDELAKGVSGEVLESMVSVLIGINASAAASYLQDFQAEAGITQFIDAGDATKSTLAKLADFVSQSISSQSQALGTGGPSQNISPTI